MTDTDATALTVLADWTGLAPDLAMVSAAEQRIANAYPPWRRREWLMGRLTARAALGLRFGEAAVTRADVLRDHGSKAPYVLGLPGVEMTLSHTGDRVACTVSPGGRKFGIDVERRGRCGPDVVHRMLGATETVPAGRDPTVHWAAKEAAYKAVHGRWASLRAYRVDWSSRQGPTVTVPSGAQLNARIWHWGATVVVLVGPERDQPTPIHLNPRPWTC